VATSQTQVFTSSGTFNVPIGVSMVRIAQMIGGGAGGTASFYNEAVSQSGGGAGELAQNIMLHVTSGGTLAITIGAGGIGGIGSGATPFGAGGAGGNTVVGPFVALGARAPQQTQEIGSGGGGGDGGGQVSNNPSFLYIQQGNSQPRNGFLGIRKAPTYFSGSEGGGGNSGSTKTGKSGGPSGGHLAIAGGIAGNDGGSNEAGGGSGASTIFGAGAAGGIGCHNGNNAPITSTGVGGGGSGGQWFTTHLGGAGSGGYVVISWVI